MNIGMLLSFGISVLDSFKYIPRSRIPGSKSRCILNFLKYLHIVLHSGCTNLHPHQQCRRVPLSPHPLQHLLFIDLLVIAMLTVVRWYLIVVFLWIFLMNSDVEHLFICLLAIYMSTQENCLFKSFAHFLIGVVCLMLSLSNPIHNCFKKNKIPRSKPNQGYKRPVLRKLRH